MKQIDIDKLTKEELENIIFDEDNRVIIQKFSYEDRLKLLSKLRKRELVLVFGHYNMSIDEYIVALKRLKEVNGSKDDFDNAYMYLKDLIDSYHNIDKLKEIYNKLKDNNLNTNYVEERIKGITRKVKPEKNDSLFWGILGAFAFSKSKPKEKSNPFSDYEDYQYEEEELEDDDYYFDDDKK